MDNFTPELRIFENGDHLIAIFDSRCKLDAKRAVRCIQIPSVFKRLSFTLEGFDEDSVTGDRRTIAGKIKLVSADADNRETEHELANCQFAIPAIKKLKKDIFQFAPVEHAVRQGVSEAFTAAISGFYVMRSTLRGDAATGHPAMTSRYNGISGVQAAAEGRRAAANDESKAFRRRKVALAAVGAPLLILFLIWSAFKMLTPSSEQVLARALMTQDPASVASQVELTKQTLRQMGLDPGQSGDIGCLAPK